MLPPFGQPQKMATRPTGRLVLFVFSLLGFSVISFFIIASMTDVAQHESALEKMWLNAQRGNKPENARIVQETRDIPNQERQEQKESLEQKRQEQQNEQKDQKDQKDKKEGHVSENGARVVLNKEQAPSLSKQQVHSRYSVKVPNIRVTDDSAQGKEQRDAIRKAFVFAYSNYEQKCLTSNELKPISRSCHTWLMHGSPLTLVDSLDTMLIMGLDDMYKRAVDHIEEHLTWPSQSVSVFETTIRYVGGLLAAYGMTRDPVLLRKTVELADKLMPAFDTPSGIPASVVHLETGQKTWASWMSGASPLAEVGTLQLEYTYLSNLTGNPDYARKARNVWTVLKKFMPKDKLYPTWVNPNTGMPQGGIVSLGGLGDSFYEYLLKYWLITEKTEMDMADWYYSTADEIIKHLVIPYNDAWFLCQRSSGALVRKMDHLSCFAGGMFALGAQYLQDDERKTHHMKIAEGIATVCREMYTMNPSKLPGEGIAISSNNLGFASSTEAYWIMRPEAVETWFILYRLTNNTKYRDWGWEFFQAIEKYSKKEFGYSGLRDVRMPNPEADDVQQSFFLAETLKYLYLLFCPHDVIPLDKFIFNTEAHPFPLYPHMNLAK